MVIGRSRVAKLLLSILIYLLTPLSDHVAAKQTGKSQSPQIGKAEVGGIVTSINGPEAGVWVIAETKDLPTGYTKIVVTDNLGRFLLPDLPQAKYDVWVRGYGLADSTPVEATPGSTINLKAKIAPTPKDAAQYYPADYWFSLMKIPAQNEFPMKPAPAPPSAAWLGDPANTNREPDATAGNGMMDRMGEFMRAGHAMDSQEQWVNVLKNGCEICHQLGDFYTRDLTHLARYNFKSSEEAWATRIHFGQLGNAHAGMMGTMLPSFVDQQRAIKMFANWTDRIAAGELPPVPPRPTGVERNVVITMWDWGKPTSHLHDETSTDKRHPTVNANGLVYAADYSDDLLLTVDPIRNVAGSITIPTIEDRRKMKPDWPQTISQPSPFYGTNLVWDQVAAPHNPMMDQRGRVWITATVRKGDQPAFCKGGSDSPYGQYFPLSSSYKQVAMYDPETKRFSLLDTCFGTHHLQFGYDKDNTLYFSNPGGPEFGWINTGVFDATGDARKAQGWCPAYLDTNGDGKIDPSVDKRIDSRGYGIIVNPLDGSVWTASPGAPGRLIRVTLGSASPKTCKAEAYEPPFSNPKMPGVFGYMPRGIDVDSHGVIWTALAGSSQLASFDRSKCKVLNGPAATGQHCPEGWTLYPTPGPKLSGMSDGTGADYEYYDWVDQFNTLGLGPDVPIVNGTGSDSIEAFDPRTRKWVVMRVPYPIGFVSRGMDGRIDDPKAGWKGRGLWATYGNSPMWHVEGGPGPLPKAVKFQIRPDPLAR